MDTIKLSINPKNSCHEDQTKCLYFPRMSSLVRYKVRFVLTRTQIAVCSTSMAYYPKGVRISNLSALKYNNN